MNKWSRSHVTTYTIITLWTVLLIQIPLLIAQWQLSLTLCEKSRFGLYSLLWYLCLTTRWWVTLISVNSVETYSLGFPPSKLEEQKLHWNFPVSSWISVYFLTFPQFNRLVQNLSLQLFHYCCFSFCVPLLKWQTSSILLLLSCPFSAFFFSFTTTCIPHSSLICAL